MTNDRVYFTTRISKARIYLRRQKIKLDLLINLMAYIIAVLGFLSLLWWSYSEMAAGAGLSLAVFQNYYFRLFFYSFIVDLFLIYRLTLIEDRKKKINPRDSQANAAAALSSAAQEVLDDSYLLASKLKQKEVLPVHLFVALLANRQVRFLFSRLRVDSVQLLKMLGRHLSSGETASTPVLSSAVQNIFIAAYGLARDNSPGISPLDILPPLAASDDLIIDILNEHEINQIKVANGVKWFQINRELLAEYRDYHRLAHLKPKTAMNRSYTALAIPTLNYYSRDLTLLAKYGQLNYIVGRGAEIKAVFDALSGGHFGVLLVGAPGTGKRSIVEAIVRLMVKEEVPQFLRDKRLVEIDIPRLMSGASAQEAEQRLLTIIDEASRSGNVILYFDNLETITGLSAGRAGSLELSEVLAKAISGRKIYCLASVNQENYVRYVESKTLGEVMTTVGVSEAGRDLAIQILESRVGFLEGKYNVYIDYPAIEKAVDLTARYINDRFLPEKALEVLEAAAQKAKPQIVSGRRKSMAAACDSQAVAEIIGELTGIPIKKISESEGQKLLSLEEKIHERLIGQDEAVKAIAGSLRRARAEVREGRRPIASFLFLGPTGVGKTELAKTVSEVYFGDEKAMIRLDMSEYQTAESVSKMIGDNDGAPGYLTEAVRKKPFALVLLDEIEKAHPDILNLFLQLMDDGRLTDGFGRTINFTNTIVVATSNVGAVYIGEAIKRQENMAIIKQELVDNQLNKFLRPELINRFDGIIVFSPLAFPEVVAITKLMLDKIKQNLSDKGIGFLVSEAGIRVLAETGYDPKFGARPLRRLLQDKVENQIADWLIAKTLKRRDLVVIDEKGCLKIEKAKEL